jgi:hypothetical protein
MITVQADFDARCLEIDEYIAHLLALESTAGTSVTLMSTMKASGVLMLYNLVESTMTNVLQAVFDHFEQNRVGFNSVNVLLQIVTLEHVKKRNSTKVIENMASASRDLMIASFDRKEVFSGNVDAMQIRNLLKAYGVKMTASYKEDELKGIKIARNELAHGSTSFAEYGKNLTATGLRDKHTKTKKILKDVIRDFSSFLSDKKYLTKIA